MNEVKDGNRLREPRLTENALNRAMMLHIKSAWHPIITTKPWEFPRFFNFSLLLLVNLLISPTVKL